MKCCPTCFGDRGLERNIIPFLAPSSGDCPTCLSRNVSVLDASDLRDYFEIVLSAYQRDDYGRPLVHWLMQDWALFEHQQMHQPKAEALLAAILEDDEIAQKKFMPLWEDPRGVSQWEELRDELMHRNRFFPQTKIDLDGLERLLWFLTLDEGEFPKLWFRARIQNGTTPIALSDMGAPPNRIASHGRANPAGIPYLYLGSSIHGAISEVRPHTGEIASVAQFQLGSGLRLIDLQRPRKTVSPFLLDPDDVIQMRNDLPFLERLGTELTRPVLPTAAAIDYTPSQYLCEFIKKCGYDGVLYRSSVSSGFNLALFTQASAVPSHVRQFCIQRSSVRISSL